MKQALFLCKHRCALAAVIILALILYGPAGASGDDAPAAYTDEACIECHQTGSEESTLHIDVAEFEASVHAGEAGCQDCHTGVVDEAHQDVEGSGTAVCSDCHEQENRHGPNGPEEMRPQCHDCHTRHNMLAKDDPQASVHARQLTVTCAGCHPVPSGKENYFSWFPAFQIASHNKADLGAAYEGDNCLGCHQGAGRHGEQEPINDQTCHRCHFSAEAPGAMWGRMHPEADMQTQPAVFAAASIYQAVMVVGLVLLAARLLRRRQRRGADMGGN